MAMVLTTFDAPVRALAEALTAQGLKMAAAESCTGGLLAAACTSLAGSSVWFERGFVTYSNEAKSEMLGVPPELIAQHGAVSAEVARAMAVGALRHSRADLVAAITGVAGPGGGSPDKPVGTVWLAVMRRSGEPCATRLALQGDRHQIQQQSVTLALQALLTCIPTQGA